MKRPIDLSLEEQLLIYFYDTILTKRTWTFNHWTEQYLGFTVMWQWWASIELYNTFHHTNKSDTATQQRVQRIFPTYSNSFIRIDIPKITKEEARLYAAWK